MCGCYVVAKVVMGAWQQVAGRISGAGGKGAQIGMAACKIEI